MQDRYVGDIGDFVKLAILRALMEGEKLGIAWWRYPDEKHNFDGRHTGYLRHPDTWRGFDPPLFDALARIVSSGTRQISALESETILPNAEFFSEHLPTTGTPAARRRERSAWFSRMCDRLKGCTFVFADPDNGLETSTFNPGAVVAGKSISLAEIQSLAAPDRVLVIYHHQSRFKGGHSAEIAHWREKLRQKGFVSVDAIRSRPFSPRAFFILNAPPKMRARAKELTLVWSGHLSWHEDDSAPMLGQNHCDRETHR